MNARWLILALAGFVVVAAWSAVAITYFFFDPTIGVWTAVVTVARVLAGGIFLGGRWHLWAGRFSPAVAQR